MMASIQKKLQDLQIRLRKENENHNESGSPVSGHRLPPINNAMSAAMTARNDMLLQVNANDNEKCAQMVRNDPPFRPPIVQRGVHLHNIPQLFPQRQYSLSATQRQPNTNLQLNIPNNRNNNILNRHNKPHSQTINAQCLSPRPRPRQLLIGDTSQRPCSPSRKPTNFGFGNDNENSLRVLRNINAADDNKLNEMFQQNNSVLTIDGNKYLAQDVDLDYMDELGSGSCGHVIRMRHTPSSKVVAVKQMRRSGNKEENKRITMDLDILLACTDCPNIVQCYGYFIKDTEVWICMELMTTCFDKLLKRLKAPIPEQILGKISVATVKALNYLKDSHGVIHRDVKPSNILINEDGVVKLCDFGISGRLVDSKAKTRSAGCAAYMAPERIDPPDTNNPSYDIRADVWSLGITLVELATGKFPYHECRTDFEVLTKVITDDPPSLPTDGGFSMDFCSFVKSCLTKDYRKRPKYKKLLEHAFIKRYEKANVNVAEWFAFVMRTNNTVNAELSPLTNN